MKRRAAERERIDEPTLGVEKETAAAAAMLQFRNTVQTNTIAGRETELLEDARAARARGEKATGESSDGKPSGSIKEEREK